MGTLHCALENGADLYVNECQKIRHRFADSGLTNRSLQIVPLQLREYATDSVHRSSVLLISELNMYILIIKIKCQCIKEVNIENVYKKGNLLRM